MSKSIKFPFNGKNYEAQYNHLRQRVIVRDLETFNSTPWLSIDEENAIHIDGGWMKTKPESIELAEFLIHGNYFDICMQLHMYNEASDKKLKRIIRRLEDKVAALSK